MRARASSRNRHKEVLQEIEQANEQQQLVARFDSNQSTVTRLLADKNRRQENREAVVADALDAICELPPPTDDATESPDASLDQDWLNYFASYAEKASSSDVRQLWGRILAGQVKRPGAFSLSALRVLSEIDAATSAKFQALVEFRLDNGELLAPEPLQGESLIEVVALEDLGLLQNAAAPFTRTINLASNEESFAIALGDLVLRGVGAFAGGISWTVIPLTRAGRQIADILPWNQEGAIRRLADRLQGKLDIDLHILTDRAPGRLSSRFVAPVRRRSKSN